MEAGDLLLAGCWDNVVELQTVNREHHPGRITIFKSLGLGLEDVAAGSYVFQQACQKGVGKPLYS
jgi:ornithine cyclodeaminase/alanine dehydrogenase-like protein (mu-crystallin family)